MPEPAPYGADLPHPLPQDDHSEWYEAALDVIDAANAEVLALREVVEKVRADCERRAGPRHIITYLPAPTGDDG